MAQDKDNYDIVSLCYGVTQIKQNRGLMLVKYIKLLDVLCIFLLILYVLTTGLDTLSH